MATDADDELDIFENSFRVFIFSLEVLSHDAVTQCEEMGNYNTPWEIQRDVAHGGVALLGSSSCYLTWEQTEKVVALSVLLRELPQEAISPPGMLTTNHAGCITAMNHPAWEPLRREAAQLLVLLEPAIKRNEAYFQEH